MTSCVVCRVLLCIVCCVSCVVSVVCCVIVCCVSCVVCHVLCLKKEAEEGGGDAMRCDAMGWRLSKENKNPSLRMWGIKKNVKHTFWSNSFFLNPDSGI